MSALNLTQYRQRLALPSILLMMSMLVLLVSLFGVHRSSTVTGERMSDLQIAWEQLQDGDVQGSELLVMDNAMRSIARPVPAISSSVTWSLAFTCLSLVLLAWLMFSAGREFRKALERGAGVENSEQASLLKLTEEVEPISVGDLRVQATQSETLAGGLATTLNDCVADMRWMVTTISSSSKMVEHSVENMRKAAQKHNADLQEQSEHIHQSSNFLLALSGAMAEISASASDTSSMAQETAEKSAVGASALSTSLDTLIAVRAETQSATVKMMRLAENARGIDERISAIEEIARRTNLLALNTTIRASGSGNSTSTSQTEDGLGQLSDEVGQLVERLVEAIKAIGAITGTMSSDVADTVVSMEAIGEAIDVSLSQTSEANKYLEEIREDAAALSLHAGSVAKSTIEHVSTVRKLTEKMDLINQISQRTILELSHDRGSVAELQQLAIELKEGASEYRLPGGTNSTSLGDKEPSGARRAAERAVIHG